MSKQPKTFQIIAAFALVYILWGSTYLAIRYAVDEIPPFLMAGARFVTAGSILFLATQFKGAPWPTKTHWLSATIIGCFLLLGGNGLVVLAERNLASGIASLIVALVPAWMVIMEWLWPGGKRPHLSVIIGLLLGFSGLGLLISGSGRLPSQEANLTGILLVTAASLSWATGSFLTSKVKLPPLIFQAIGMQMLSGGIIMLTIALLRGEFFLFDLSGLTWKGIVAFGYLVVFGGLLGYTSYVWLLGHVSLSSASTYAFVNPVIAVLLGWLVADETITPRIIMAIIVIVAGVALIVMHNYKKSKKQGLP